MANIFDAAEFILQRQGSMSAMKLQKLLYYSQAWSMVWDDAELFPEDFQAWVNGPVCKELFDKHKQVYTLDTGFTNSGNSDNLTPSQKETVDVVLNTYGSWTGEQLSALTHTERPWLDARAGLAPLEYTSRVIPKSVIADYFTALYNG